VASEGEGEARREAGGFGDLALKLVDELEESETHGRPQSYPNKMNVVTGEIC